MKPILYVNGCSNTAGAEITHPGQHTPELDGPLTFGAVLANRWNMELKNDAVPGQGNDAIYSQTVNSILNLLKTHDSNDIFALIGFAGIDRRDFIYNGVWARMCANMGFANNTIKHVYKNWVETSDYNFDMNKFATTYIGLVKFLEKYNIKYCFFNSSFGMTTTSTLNVLHSDNKIDNNIFNHMKNNNRWLGCFDESKDFHRYLLDAGFKIAPSKSHHGVEAHMHWANVLEEFISTNQLRPIQQPQVPVSWGELIDKITILEIKLDKITSNPANDNIKKELKYLTNATCKLNSIVVKSLKDELKLVNLQLWQIEDDIRNKEAKKEFDDEFIRLARTVYKVNDRRADLKRKINIELSSNLTEEKSYAKF